MDKQTLVIKLGGALIENDEALTALFATLKTFLDDQHRPLVLVHGGGCLVDDLLKGLGMTSTKKNGLRVTPFEQIPFIAGALAGTANKMMMAKAIATGIPAVGLCLADGGLCQVTQLDPDLGAVGDCQPGNPALVAGILGQGFLPVVSSIGITADGQLMNVNADQAATAIAEALGADLGEGFWAAIRAPCPGRTSGSTSRSTWPATTGSWCNNLILCIAPWRLWPIPLSPPRVVTAWPWPNMMRSFARLKRMMARRPIRRCASISAKPSRRGCGWMPGNCGCGNR